MLKSISTLDPTSFDAIRRFPLSETVKSSILSPHGTIGPLLHKLETARWQGGDRALEIDQALLDVLPDGAAEVVDGRVTAVNRAMLRFFPGVTAGGEAPPLMRGLAEGSQETGALSVDGTPCTFIRAQTARGALLLLRDQSHQAIEGHQLDGFLRCLREEMAQLMMGLETLSAQETPARSGLEGLSRSLYQMMRMVNNLETMREEPHFSPVTMDLAGLCRQLGNEVAPLVGETGTKLTVQCGCATLLIPGDPALLRRMLLGLLSNSVRAARAGEVVMTLQRLGDRAVIVLSDSGVLPPQQQMADLLQGRGREPIPAPGEGAGLGLPVARRIVQLHGGTMLLDRGAGGGLQTTVALPTGPLDPNLTLRAPRIDQGGGLDPLLLELSDVLPARVFRPEDLE